MKLNTTNPNHLIYNTKPLQLEVMGGIDLKYLNRLRVTLKVTRTDQQRHPLRDQLDLYQDSQLTRLIRRIAEKFETGSHPSRKNTLRANRRTRNLPLPKTRRNPNNKRKTSTHFGAKNKSPRLFTKQKSTRKNQTNPIANRHNRRRGQRPHLIFMFTQ